MLRYGYVVLGDGPVMFFEVRGGKVSQPSPRMPYVRGWPEKRLRAHFRMQRRMIYAVARQSG